MQNTSVWGGGGGYPVHPPASHKAPCTYMVQNRASKGFLYSSFRAQVCTRYSYMDP